MIRPPLAPLLLALCATLACGSSQRDIEAKQSAGRVAHAIEVVRDAPNAAKATALAELTKVACSGPDVCETKGACRSAYALHVEATPYAVAGSYTTLLDTTVPDSPPRLLEMFRRPR